MASAYRRASGQYAQPTMLPGYLDSGFNHLTERTLILPSMAALCLLSRSRILGLMDPRCSLRSAPLIAIKGAKLEFPDRHLSRFIYDALRRIITTQFFRLSQLGQLAQH